MTCHAQRFANGVEPQAHGPMLSAMQTATVLGAWWLCHARALPLPLIALVRMPEDWRPVVAMVGEEITLDGERLARLDRIVADPALMPTHREFRACADQWRETVLARGLTRTITPIAPEAHKLASLARRGGWVRYAQTDDWHWYVREER